MDKLIFIIILISLIEAMIKKVDILEEMKDGILEGMKLVVTLFPVLLAFMIWINLFQSCGITTVLQSVFEPLLAFLQIPIDLFMMMMIRPFSSNASLSILVKIFKTYGVDHAISMLASMIQSGSDTTFYVVSLYFGSIGLKNSRYALLLGLWLDFITCLLSLFIYLQYLK